MAFEVCRQAYALQQAVNAQAHEVERSKAEETRQSKKMKGENPRYPSTYTRVRLPPFVDDGSTEHEFPARGNNFQLAARAVRSPLATLRSW